MSFQRFPRSQLTVRSPLLICLGLAITGPLILRGQDKLRVIGRPAITAESLCDPDGNATGSMILRNETTASVPIHLSAGDLSSKSPSKQLLIQPALTPKDTDLDSKQNLEVKIAIAGLYEDGDWQTTIQNDGADIGTLRIVRNSPPFTLSLDVATPDAPQLTFVKGETGHFRLKNDDPREYQIFWQYSVNGYVVRSTDSLVPKTENRSWICRWFCKDASSNTGKPEAQSGPIALLTLPPRGQQEFAFDPPPKWFGGSFSGLFKDKVADGRLTVSMVSPRCATRSALSKTFNVKTSLLTSTGARREGWADFWVFVFLALGGIFSLSLNSLLQNQMRRTKMKQRLSSAGARISGLSYDLASRLRVQIGLGQRLITDRLRNLTWTSPDFAGDMQDIEQAMTRLETRLQLLESLSIVRTNFIRTRAEVLPASVIFSIETKFDKIVEIGEKTDPPIRMYRRPLALLRALKTSWLREFWVTSTSPRALLIGWRSTRPTLIRRMGGSARPIPASESGLYCQDLSLVWSRSTATSSQPRPMPLRHKTTWISMEGCLSCKSFASTWTWLRDSLQQATFERKLPDMKKNWWTL
jgi:hypothetical protein